MPTKPKPRTWCRPMVCAQIFDVVLASEETCEHLVGREAVTVYEDTLIAVREDLSDERKIDGLGHELFGHAVLEAYGIDVELKERLGLTDSQYRKLDEFLSGKYAPALMATLRVNGWLRLPPLPKKRGARPRAVAEKKRGTR